MSWDEQVRLLRAKADDDIRSMHILISGEDAPETSIGFFAQQAVEKLLKALLNHRRVEYKKSHDLVYLMQLLSDHGTVVPAEIRQAGCLQPYAVDLRYDDIPYEGASSFDQTWVAQCVETVSDWVDAQLSKTPDDDKS